MRSLGTATYKGRTQALHASDQGFSIWVEHRPGYIDVEASQSMLAGALAPEFGRIPATATGPTWEGHYRMPLVRGVQKVSGFCGYLAANTPPDITMQLRTATDVQVSISPE